MFQEHLILDEKRDQDFFREYFLKRNLWFPERVQAGETLVRASNKNSAWIEDTLSGMENNYLLKVL
jgi:hypothetical protein